MLAREANIQAVQLTCKKNYGDSVVWKLKNVCVYGLYDALLLQYHQIKTFFYQMEERYQKQILRHENKQLFQGNFMQTLIFSSLAMTKTIASKQENCLVTSRTSLPLWGEGASLGLVGHPSSDGVTIKMPLHPIFSYWVG